MALRAQRPQLERRYTSEEFEQLPEFDERYELIDGRLVEKPVSGGEHTLIIDTIRDAIKFFDPGRKLGYSLQESTIRLGPDRAPIPDISYWKADRNVKIVKGAMPRPDLAVEVHSPSDLQSKSALDSAMVKVRNLLDGGVPIVWVVYPNRQEVHVYHADQGYQAGPVQQLGINDTLNGENIIPGFELPVATLFEYED